VLPVRRTTQLAGMTAEYHTDLFVGTLQHHSANDVLTGSYCMNYLDFVYDEMITLQNVAGYLRQGGYVIVVVCLFVCLLATLTKTSERICMKFSGKVGKGPLNK